MKFLFVIYDNASYVNDFPLGPAYLISVMRKHSYKDIAVYNQDVYHYPDAHLTDYLDKNHFDYVGIGVIGGYYQYRKLLRLCEAVNRSKDRPMLILGGHGPSPIPEYILKKTRSDIAVIGEAEMSLLNLLDALGSKKPLSGVKGIAYREGDEVFVNEREKPIRDIDTIPFPAWDAFPMDHYVLRYSIAESKLERTFPVLSCRGCMYRCNFCYRMDEGYRMRSMDAIIEEIKRLKKDYAVSFIRFRDELLMATEKRALEFCEKALKENLDIRFECNGRLNVATKKVLREMKKAGAVYINYGIESLDQDVLDKMNKKQTVEEIISGIGNTIAEGIHPGFNILWGNIGDTPATLKKAVDFLLKYDTRSEPRNIKPVIPYPGSPLYDIAVKKGLLAGAENFYEVKHLNSDMITVNFTDMKEGDMYRLLYEANNTLMEAYYKDALCKTTDSLKRLYFDRDVSFRGLRHY